MSNTIRSLRLLAIGLLATLLFGTSAATGTLADIASAEPRATAAANALPLGPIGWDTYRRLDRLAEIGRGSHARLFSSFDRTDGNNDGFEGTYSCLRQSTAGCVIADHQGAGEVTSIWFTRDGGDVSRTGTITIELDGKTVVSSSLQELVDGKRGAPFVYPLVANADQSSGGVYVKVPMTYRTRMTITMQSNPFFYRVNYRTFDHADGVTTFDPSDQALDVIEKLKAFGTADPKPAQPGSRTVSDVAQVAPNASAVLAQSNKPGALTGITLRLPQLAITPVDRTRKSPAKPSPSSLDPRKARWLKAPPLTAKATQETSRSDTILAGARMRITFDGVRTVDSPIGEFFGSGLGLYRVRSMMFSMDPETRTLRAWWLMPYGKSVKVELYNGSNLQLRGATWTVAMSDNAAWTSKLANRSVGHFRTTTNAGAAEFDRDHSVLDVTGTGRMVGITQTISGQVPVGNIQGYLEGDERIFIDGSASPDQHGTGNEDFYEGGWYFNRGPFSAPMNGHSAHEVRGGGCQNSCSGLFRLLLADAVDFSSSLRFGSEIGAGNDFEADVSSTAYWYGAATNTSQWVDTVDVGNAASEQAHGYTAAQSSAAVSLTSRFHGIDGPTEPVTADGRTATGPVSFTVAVSPDNRGVTLRRISDQAQAGQSASVSVDGTVVGQWLQPQGNATRRWLDDSFVLPASATAGKQQLTVTLMPSSGSAPWHAAAYQAVSRRPQAPDTQAPTPVTGLAASAAVDTSVTLGWKPVSDDIYAPKYQIYASQTKGFQPAAGDLVDVAKANGFVHEGLDVRQTWYYRVRAVDAVGRTGDFSAEVSVTTGRQLTIEGESLITTATADAPLTVQGNCCGVVWSGNAQLWFTPTEAGRKVTATFEIGTAGRYALTGAQTLAPDYGINVLRIDGKQVGGPFDGYRPAGVGVSDPIDYGTLDLSAGRHTLVLEVTGKDPAAISYMAGLDYLRLVLQD